MNQRINKNNLAVTQSNRLVEARYSLSLNEQRIVLYMISLIQPEDEDFKDYSLKLSDIVNMAGLKNKNIYTELQDLLIGLRRKTLVIPNSDGYLVSGWVSSAEFRDKEGVVLLSFDAKLKPYLLKLKEQFTKYRLCHVTNFRSTYTIRIYMLLKQYETIGYREFDLQEFRQTLDIKNKYAKFPELRRWVINVAQKEFSKKDKNGKFLSDITFTLETIRSGRKVGRLRFIIKKQKTNGSQIELPIIEDDSNSLNIITEYEAYGISRNITLPHIEQQGEQAVIDCLNLFKEQTEKLEMKNPSGYLLGMLNNGAGEKGQAEQEKEKRQRKEAKAKQAAEYQRKREQQRKKLEVAFIKQAKQEYINDLSEQQKADLLKESRKVYQDNPAILNMIKDINSPIVEGYLTPKIPNLETRKEAYIKQNLKL